MKKIAILLSFLLISGSLSLCFAQTKSVSSQVYSGIANYKKANYTGCIQDMEAALKKNPNDILAKYYLALVYTKIGMSEDAKKYYQAVVDQGNEKLLVKYSQRALTCLDKPDDKICAVKKELDDDGNIIFSVDMDTIQVIISGDSVRIGGKTATTAINDVLQESKDYSDGKLADFADTVTEDLTNIQAHIIIIKNIVEISLINCIFFVSV